eukprot:m.187312 g.187312  ORF g.187312 m.187312 type:complete len:854 (+) comp25616_c0_seq5:39-2600(+)
MSRRRMAIRRSGESVHGKKKEDAPMDIHRAFTMAQGAKEIHSMEELAHRMLGSLGKETFLLCSKFLLAVLHNIITNPNEPVYRKMKTTSKTVSTALEDPNTQQLLQFLNMKSDGEYYNLEGEIQIDRLANVENALTRARKKLYVLEAWELFPSDIMREEQLGAGAFGEVYKGTWRGRSVAIKSLKPEASERTQQDFVMEANVMKNFKHANVLGLLGVVMKRKPNFIVMELLSANLQDRLRVQTYTTEQKLRKAMEMAAGLEYVHHQNILHCDIAARNVLVGEQDQLKLADFGLARQAHSPECDVSRRVFPISVRWSPPEVWRKRFLTKHTDIWSFGVLFFEIMTAGAVPYLGMSNAEVQKKVESGYRLPCPQDCPPEFHAVMMKCWDIDGTNRPSAHDLVEQLLTLKVTLAHLDSQRAQTPTIKLESDSTVTRRTGSAGFNRKAVKKRESMGPFTYFLEHMAKQGVDESTTDEEKVKIESTLPLNQQPWFHGQVSSKRIKERVEPHLGRRGDFVVHETHMPDEFILSVMWKVPLHIPVKPDEQGRLGTGEGKTFDSIIDLVFHHVNTQEPLSYHGHSINIVRPVSTALDEEEDQVDEQEEQRDQSYDAFICYQPETEGDLARTLYNELQETSNGGTEFTCFLDQYDLVTNEEQNWEAGIRKALLKAKVFVAVISERSLAMVKTMSPWDSMLVQYEMALKLYDDQKIRILPIFVGQYIEIEHPSKKGKFFNVYDNFDQFDPSQFKDEPSESAPDVTVRATMARILEMKDRGLFINPTDDDLHDVAEDVVANFYKLCPSGKPSTATEDTVAALNKSEGSSTPRYYRTPSGRKIISWSKDYTPVTVAKSENGEFRL